jgi:hypothetical protein
MQMHDALFIASKMQMQMQDALFIASYLMYFFKLNNKRE